MPLRLKSCFKVNYESLTFVWLHTDCCSSTSRNVWGGSRQT